MCVCVRSCQTTEVLISKYLATRRVVVSVGGVNGSERQLLTSLIHRTLIGVHSTMHLVDPIKVHVSCVCCLCVVFVRMCVF